MCLCHMGRLLTGPACTHLPSTSCSLGGLLVWLTVTPNLSGYSASSRATSWDRPAADAPDSTSRRGGARCGFERLSKQQLATPGRPYGTHSRHAQHWHLQEVLWPPDKLLLRTHAVQTLQRSQDCTLRRVDTQTHLHLPHRSWQHIL